MHENSLPHCELQNTKEGVEHVMEHFSKAVSPVRKKWPLGPAKEVEAAVPETKVAESDDKVNDEPGKGMKIT